MSQDAINERIFRRLSSLEGFVNKYNEAIQRAPELEKVCSGYAQEVKCTESRIHNRVTGFYMLLDKDLKEFKASLTDLQERVKEIEGIKDDLLNLADLAGGFEKPVE